MGFNSGFKVLTELNTWDIYWEVRQACVNRTHKPCVRLTYGPNSRADCLEFLGASISWIPKGLPRPVMGLLIIWMIVGHLNMVQF